METHVGIVLKKYTEQATRLLVFDRRLGKLSCSAFGTELSVGSLITYNLARTTTLIRLTAIKLLDLPFDAAHDDILFLHHVYELCTIFLPLEEPISEVFTLLMVLYTDYYKLREDLSKKIFLGKLMIIVGAHAFENKQPLWWHRMHAESLDTLLHEFLDLHIEQELNEWLYQCVMLHPYARYLKTSYFLSKSKTV